MRIRLAILAATLASAFPLASEAALPEAEALVKGSGAAVYYLGSDGRRHVFPSEGVYFSWFRDFSRVRTVTDAELASLPLGGSVRYRPGIRMVKLRSVPTVYAVAGSGVLRPIASESVAAALYGSEWNAKIDDLSDAFFVDYEIGAVIEASADYAPEAEAGLRATIASNMGHGAGPVTLASDTEVGGRSEIAVRSVLHDVAFVPQAPFAEWNDLRQQEACEESSVFMAVMWARGESFTYEEARAEFLAISEWEEDNWGYYHDTSVQDTADRLFRQWFSFDDIEVRSGITTDDVLSALLGGHVVVTAVNGETLENPWFSEPGPVRHMVLVVGYDAATDDFLVHDPGTRRGEAFRYSRSNLELSLRDYPSGRYAPITPMPNAMIVVRKP